MVTRVIAEGIELAEALGFPEISALGDTERRWRTALEAKARSILDSSTAFRVQISLAGCPGVSSKTPQPPAIFFQPSGLEVSGHHQNWGLEFFFTFQNANGRLCALAGLAFSVV